MSWVKRRSPAAPSPTAAPPAQMYNPNDHSKQENHWQTSATQDQQSSWYSQNQQSYRQPIQQQTQQQTPYWSQNYSTQSTHPQQFSQNTNQYSQEQNPYYRSVDHQQPRGNAQYKQNVQHNSVDLQQPQGEADAWNWGWGDEDNSNLQSNRQPSNVLANTNVNSLAESFSNDSTWGWSVEDSNSTTSSNFQQEEAKKSGEPFPKIAKVKSTHSVVQQPDQGANQYVTLDHLKVSGNRGRIDNLTPQWSVESQMSQDSSDDILHTSESDKSHILSRSSTLSQSSASVSAHDPSENCSIKPEPNATYQTRDFCGTQNLNSSVTPGQNLGRIESVPVKRERVNMDNAQFIGVGQGNREIVTASRNELQSVPLKTETPPLPPKNQTPPLTLPQTVTSDRRVNPLMQRSANRFRIPTQDATRNQYHQNTSYSGTFNQINLETLPDNSEQPDFPVLNQRTRKISPSKALNQWQENVEVTPMNDRNQYLETGQLSDVDLHEFNQAGDSGIQLQQEISDTLPPPGLRRMVLGQIEHSEMAGGDNRNNDSFGEEPPPGLSRLVLGQTESTSVASTLPQLDNQEPPLGLHRMVPGESSSPETTARQQNYQSHQISNYASETELTQLTSQISPQPRSATIGADTPPAGFMPSYSISGNTSINRSETLGSATPGPVSAIIPNGNENRIGVVGLVNPIRETHADGGNTLDESEGEGNRRESIEGQPEDNEIGNLVSSVRNLTVGENPTDSATSAVNVPEPVRRQSRQESSESDRERRNLSPRDRKDRKYRSKSGKNKEQDRFSPENYRERKHDKQRIREKRYDDETDYYSEKEKDRKGREDYDRKYSSLRRDKERDKRRRDHGRDGRRDYYYGRYEDEYNIGSRPSSRSDSLHENYKERGHDRDNYRHRDRDRDHNRHQHRRPREPFSNYMQMYGYDPYNPYYQQYQYYENLRLTNPQAYAEWYRKYYQQASGQTGTYGREDRASVHSGRSSANDELAKDRYARHCYYNQASSPHAGGYYRDTHSVSSHYGLDVSSYSRPFDQTDNSLNLEEASVASQRMTPAKFATAHLKASISSGNLIKILPQYPFDGQSAAVEICSIQSLLINDDEYKELVRFPGPLVKGVTHKKTIIEYCESKIRHASLSLELDDCQSYILMWELLILLIRQNGMVVGADIAELLMKDRPRGVSRRPSSVASSISSNAADGIFPESSNQQNAEIVHSSSTSVLREDVVTNKFREYLIYGSGKEALEWAMKHGLWGHALFLASKLDKRTYANVMMRFANGLTMNDPLQTLYQLLSGRLPAAVTCVADEKWGDWKPHLAMILSNTTQRPELDRKAITTLADTLLVRGSLYAAQFCYLMAQVEFSRYGDPNAKLVLLGSNHAKPFRQFAIDEAIHMTEIYEYACSLNDGSFILKEFQYYKYLLATKLADRGLLERALAYMERVSIIITQNPTIASSSFVNVVCNLADRLKYYDPAETHEGDSFDNDLDISRPDNSWLKDLKALQANCQMGVVSQENEDNYSIQAQEVAAQSVYEQNQDAWQQPQFEQQQFQQNPWQPVQYVDQNQATYQQQQQLEQDQSQNGYQSAAQDPQQFWANQQQWTANTDINILDQYNQQQQVSEQPNDYWSNAQKEPAEVEKAPCEEVPRSQISLPNQSKGPTDDAKEAAKKDSPVKPKPAPAQSDKQATTGWFGGIWSKLALRPKNQMKLPDDKNPTIVWDPEKKKWVNLEAEGTEESTEIKPPPKMSDMFQKTKPPTPQPGKVSVNQLPSVQQRVPGVAHFQNQQISGNTEGVPAAVHQPNEDIGLPPKPNQPNMFKLQRNRNLKKSYVDIFNPSGKSGGNGPSSIMASEVFPSLPSAGQQMNFFVPQPVANADAPTDFLTPGVPQQGGDANHG